MRAEAGGNRTPPFPSTTRLSDADGRRLRVALRLVFNPEHADRLAILAVADDDGDRGLVAAAQAAERRYTSVRVLRRLTLRSEPRSVDPPLGPHTGARARGAVDLALHLGLGLDGETLADLTGDTPERVGELLLQARRAITRGPETACPEFTSAIGRHRDRALDIGARAALFRHARECGACAAAIAACETVDAELLQRAQAFGPDFPPLRARRSPVERAVPVVALLILIVVLGAALAVLAAGMRGPTSSPAVAMGQPSPTRLSGWLLTSSSDGAVTALDLRTGAIRAVAPSGPSGRYVRRLLSPDGRLIASWTPPYGPNGPEPTGTITVSHLDGTAVRSWGLGGGPGPGAGSLIGWLGSSSVLIAQAPPWQSQVNLTNAASQSQLVALDVNTGVSRVLFQGSISSASASPDGTRVVLIQAYDQHWRGLTADLRALGSQGLGPPLATVDHQLAPDSAVVWAPDSSRVYLARITDAAATEPALVRAGPSTSEIDAFDRDGHETPAVPATTNRLAYPVSASPGDTRLVYVQQGPAPADMTGQVWLARLDGSQPVSVAKTAVPTGLNVAWLPDGSALIRDDLPFYLPADPAEQAQGTVTWPVLLQVSQDGVMQPAAASPTAADGVGWLGWEPADALPALSSNLAARQPVPGAPEVVAHSGAGLDAGSSSSPDGRLVVLTDPRLPGSVIWDSGSGSEARQLRGAADLSWVPGTQTLIGVSEVAGASRVTLYAGGLAGAPVLDFRHFDPAGIGSAPGRSYARPLVAPGGVAVSVFVTDTAHHAAELWVSGWYGEPRMVARWTTGSTALSVTAPVAAWATTDVLLYAEPADWQRGLPQAVDIQRVVVDAGGASSPATVAVVRAHGADRGIELTDLALSPDGSYLAWRVRHLTGPDATSGRYDTIDVASLTGAAAPLEIERADPGEGLAWSPDGRWLATGIGGRVVLLADDGSTSIPLSPTGIGADDPLWVGANDIWYSITDAAGTRTVQVPLHSP